MQYLPDKANGWRTQASCRDMDPELFCVGDGINLDFALGTCDTCPVMLECRQDARGEDFIHTVRGGLTPIGYTGEPRGRPASKITYNAGLKECGKGHDTWVNGRYTADMYCVLCRNHRREKNHTRLSEAEVLAIRAKTVKYGDADKIDHTNKKGRYYNSVLRMCAGTKVTHDTHKVGRYTRSGECIGCRLIQNANRQAKHLAELERRATLKG